MNCFFHQSMLTKYAELKLFIFGEKSKKTDKKSPKTTKITIFRPTLRWNFSFFSNENLSAPKEHLENWLSIVLGGCNAHGNYQVQKITKNDKMLKKLAKNY